MKPLRQKELSARLRRLRAAIDRNLTNLNYGGCGVFAYHVCKALKKLGVEAEIVVPHYGNDGSASPREDLDRGASVFELARSHVGVRYRLGGVTYTADSTRVAKRSLVFGRHSSSRTQRNGAFRVSLEYPFGKGVQPSEYQPVVRDGRYWNSSFDRKSIPKLRTLIDAYLVQGVL